MIWAPSDDNGCRFSHHCRQQAGNAININKIDFLLLYFKLCYNNFSSRTLPNTLDRSPEHSIEWNYQLHVAGGASNLATMVAVIFGSCCGVVSLLMLVAC